MFKLVTSAIGKVELSIQLVSPSSGELPQLVTPNGGFTSFHSISFPSEWGVFRHDGHEYHCSVSIQLVSPASGEEHTKGEYCFVINVSIQLVSPASGESTNFDRYVLEVNVSIQLVSPASGEFTLQ